MSESRTRVDPAETLFDYTHVSQAPFLGGQVVIQIGVLTHIKMMACS